MIKRSITQRDKKIIKAVVLLLFILIGAFQVAFFYINDLVKPASYEKQILADIKKQTGQDVKIKGGIKFSLLPSPKLIVSDLIVGADSFDGNSSQIPIFYIESVEINIAPTTLLSDKIKLSSIKLVSPTLLLQRSDDNIIHWDWLNTKLLKALNNKSGNGISLPVLIKDGSVKYKDIVNNKKLVIENIDAHSVFGSEVSLNGSMQSAGRKFDFVIDGKVPQTPIKDSEFTLNLQLSDASNDLVQIQSIIDPSGEFPKVYGKFAFKAADIDEFLTLMSNEDSNKSATTSKSPSPIAVNGSWELVDDIIKMSDLAVEGLNSKGTGSASISWDRWYPTIATDLDFEYIDYLTWKGLLERKITNKAPKKFGEFQGDEVQSYDFRKENPLPENIEIRLNINAQKVLFDKEEWNNTRLNAVLDNGSFTINQCDIKLEGDGVLSIFGVVSQGGTGELRFEGNMETQGKSLRKAIAMFYSSAKDLPPIAMEEFSVHANMYITAGQIRLFETSGTVDGVNLDGTITIFMESPLRIDIAVKMQNVNFDYIRDEMRRQRKEELLNKYKNIKNPAAESEALGFDWLKYLGVRIDAKVIIDGFTFMERTGEHASFSIYAYRGDFRLSDFQLVYPEGTDEYNCILDARNKLPFINLMVSADKIDTNYFDLEPKAADDAQSMDDPKKELLKKSSLESAVPLDWMEDFNGVFDITLNKLVHRNFVMDKIKFQAKLDNKKLIIQKLGFVFSQAQSQIVGTLYGGKVPGINVSFTMENADIYEVINPITGMTNISGFANLSGNISTSGWNFLEWLQHSDSKLLLAARGVKVQGINIDGVTSVVDVARSSADVFNNVNNVLTKGTTEFSVDGALNIKDGELRAPNISLRSGLVTGSLVGGMKLENLTGQFSSTFRFPNLSSDMIPTLIIQLSGNMDKPEIKVDTASLEAFVAKRNIIK